MKLVSKLLPPLLAGLLMAGDASAWEATTTHAGLTEQSAFSSDLHGYLSAHAGQDNGIYTSLTIPKADAPQLFSVLATLNPTHGYTPDARGQMSALGWLVAGSVLADMPVSQAENHFFDPRTSAGLSGKTGLKRDLYLSLVSIGSPSNLSQGGQAANTWWSSAKNPMGYVGFAGQFRKSVSAPSPAARSRHLAGSLLAAGSMLHVLQDMGSPSHVRNDLAAHQEQVGLSEDDRGSRFERIAALAFGRLGISRSQTPPNIASLSDHFSNPTGTGLADYIEKGFFSSHTLPREFSIRRDAGSSTFQERITANLRRPQPAADKKLDLIAARNSEGATWSNESGVCLTRYKHKQSRLTWWIDDKCALEQLEEILPVVSGYGASFLRTLFRTDLKLRIESGKIVTTGDAKLFGTGKITFFAERNDGTRTEYHSATRTGTSSELSLAPAPPEGTVKIAVLFDGKNLVGKPLLMTTQVAWPASP